MLIQGLDKIIIISPFGERDRFDEKTQKTIHEFHPGVDIRVFDKQHDPGASRILSIVAPEDMTITRVEFDQTWGHWIVAKPDNANSLGIIEFRFWHQKPEDVCIVGSMFGEGMSFAMPESGYVPLHLHFETRIAYRGTTQADPVQYLKLIGQEYEYA
jgi:hypothetical protein